MSKKRKNKNTIKEKEVNINIPTDTPGFNFAILQEINKYIKSTEYNPRKYSRENVRKFLERPEVFERQLREISQYSYISFSRYFRLINYFSDMLTLDSILVPLELNSDKVNSTSFKRAYERANRFIENYNIKHTLKQIIRILLVEDVFFGYERSINSSLMIQRLPTNYCKITGIEDGVYTFAFNFEYFNGNANLSIDNFPDEFKSLYNKAKTSGEIWQELNSEFAVCFKLNENLIFGCPPFMSLYEELMDMEDIKSLIKTRNNLDNFKLMLQKIPLKKDAKSDRDILFDAKTVKGFHTNIRSVLPQGIGLVSSPMELEDFSFERKRDKVEDNATQAEENLFNAAGSSSGLFNSGNNNSISLNRGINVDESMMFTLLRQFERYFKKRLGFINNNQNRFKLIFPDLTIYNWKEKLDSYLKTATYGFPKSLVAASIGLSTSDVDNLCLFENEYLGLPEKLKPLSSAHTSSGDEEGGAPEKDDGNLSPAGEKTKAGETNKTRAK